jgi:hypothetical protein
MKDENHQAQIRIVLTFSSLWLRIPGMYRVEGNTWVTKVDVAANPALNGTEQRRSFQLTGDRLQESTDAVPWAIHPEKGLVKFVISYRRAK